VNNLRILFLSFSMLALAACNPNTASAPNDNTSLSDQLGELKSDNMPSLEELPGKNAVEKLLYLQGVPQAVKSTTLIFLDGQISTLEKTGQTETANTLKNNRKLLVQAIDENMHEYVEGAAEVYKSTFTGEEIEELVKIHNSPAMRKLTDNQIEIQQDILPLAEQWGQKVATKFQSLVASQPTEKNAGK